jgi:hypothetical protein
MPLYFLEVVARPKGLRRVGDGVLSGTGAIVVPWALWYKGEL